MGFEDDPQANTADLVGRVKKADPFTFENKLGGSCIMVHVLHLYNVNPALNYNVNHCRP